MNTKRAEMLMLLVTFCWGSSYLFMKEGLTSIGPFTLIAYRFLIAFAAAAVLARFPLHKGAGQERIGRRKKTDRLPPDGERIE